MNLAKMRILTEAPNDDVFDIDKEVDAQLKRVENRIARKNNANNPPPPEEQPNDNQMQDQNEEQPQDEQQPQEEPAAEDDMNQENDLDQQPSEDDGENADGQPQDTEYLEDNNQGADDIPDDYEPKQKIPELKILSTLSDSEYSMLNTRILESFIELRGNVDSTINNILMTITTKNAKQRQAIDIVHRNLNDMLEDIDNYILYRNKNVYEENVIAYLTYLKRYQIATRIVKLIVDENSKELQKETK